MADELVICVGEERGFNLLERFRPHVCPKRGHVYTIARVHRDCPDCGESHLELEEFPTFFEGGYPAIWFRRCKSVDTGRFLERLFQPVDIDFSVDPYKLDV